MNTSSMEQLTTERVYIDPERLLQLKKERKTFKHVPSIFEPPPEPLQTQPTSNTQPKHTNRSSLHPQELLASEAMVRNVTPNIDYVMSLIGEIKPNQVLELEQGDCLNVKNDERCMILEGQIKVTGVGNRTFTLNEGNILFINTQTIKKIRQLICVKAAKVLKLPELAFTALRNYIFMKNAEKIKCLRYCPFFIWSQKLTQDIAACMTMQIYEKGTTLYKRGEQADKIYFAKEGVILLERNNLLASSFFTDYETHYQRNQISPAQTTLVVKKGMVFGIDGILLKDFEQSVAVTKDQDNPQNQKTFQRRSKPTVRVYTARTIGRTEVYALDRSILQGLFDAADLLSAGNVSRQLSKHDLQKISSDYADMVVRHRSLPKLSQVVMKKEIVLEQPQVSNDQQQKKVKVRRIREVEELTKKHSIAKIIVDQKLNRTRDLNNSIVLQQHFSQKLGFLEHSDNASLAFPRLSSNLRKKRVLRKDEKSESVQKYMFQWVKSNDPMQKKESAKKDSGNKQRDKVTLVNIRSYRSIAQVPA